MAFTLAVAAIAWVGLAWQFILSMQSMLGGGRPLLSAVIWYFSFFTILTNLVVAVDLTVLGLAPRSKSALALAPPRIQTGIAAAILLVGIGYELLIRQSWDFNRRGFLADFLLHDLSPATFALYWVLCVRKGDLAWRDIWPWTLYPAAYCIYSLTYGAVTAEYPYPFLDAGRLGLARVMTNTAALVVGFLFLACVLVAVDSWLGYRSVAGARTRR
jgi:hypothetical protein